MVCEILIHSIIFVPLKIYIDKGTNATYHHKIATNQSLNQKSRCFYIGALFFYLFNVLLMAIKKMQSIQIGISIDLSKIV